MRPARDRRASRHGRGSLTKSSSSISNTESAPMSAVFHLLAIFVKVVEPADVSWRHRRARRARAPRSSQSSRSEMEGNGRRARAGRHEDLPDPVLEGSQGLLVDLRGASRSRSPFTHATRRRSCGIASTLTRRDGRDAVRIHSNSNIKPATTSSDGHESHGRRIAPARTPGPSSPSSPRAGGSTPHLYASTLPGACGTWA